MRTHPLVSVIIPTYNRAGTVGESIDSVLGQTYPNIEVILVDDGSTDNTQTVLRSYGDRIRVVTQANAGPAIARNRGIAVARGDIVALLDSDDLWLQDKITRQVRSLCDAGSEVTACLCNCTVLYPSGRRTSTFDIGDTMPKCPSGIWKNPAEVLLNRFVMFNQAVAIRREVLERVGYFDETLRFGEDYDLPFRLALEGPWTILRDELVVYHAGSEGSWAEKAMREEIRMREDLVRIRESMAASVVARPPFAHLRWLAARELRRERRELRIARFTRRQVPGAAVLGKSLQVVERLRRALFRRGPFYPRLVVEELRAFSLKL